MSTNRETAALAEEILALAYALEHEAADEGLEVTDTDALQAAVTMVAARQTADRLEALTENLGAVTAAIYHVADRLPADTTEEAAR